MNAVQRLVADLTRPGMSWVNMNGEKHPLTLEDILIVSPYNAQVFDLAARLPQARIGTVDKFQGQEAPVVIYSMATSSPEDAPRGMEFLYSINRFNVATSRARCACFVVASPRLLEPECQTPRQMKLANALCRYLEMSEIRERQLVRVVSIPIQSRSSNKTSNLRTSDPAPRDRKLHSLRSDHAHLGSETHSAQQTDHPPAEIHLPPAPAKAGGRGRRVMVAMPVLSPRGELKRPEPPYISAGIDALGKPGLKVQKAVHERLHVKAVDETDCTQPEQTFPSKKKVTKADRNEDQRNLQLGPKGISAANHVRGPDLHGRRLPLIEPSQMGPPESTMTRTGHVIDSIRLRMMIPMVRDPCIR